MKRPAIVAALALAVIFTLTGCDSREACEARGGVWAGRTVLMPTLVGKVMVLIPQTVHECTVDTNRTQEEQ